MAVSGGPKVVAFTSAFVVASIAVCCLILTSIGPDVWILLGFFGVAIAGGLLKLFAWERRRQLKISVRNDRLCLLNSSGAVEREMEFRGVTRYGFGEKGDSFWLRFRYADGRVVTIGERPRLRGVVTVGSDLPNRRNLVRVLAPHMPDSALPEPLPQESNAIAHFLFEHAYRASAVQMQPGVRYGYRDPQALKAFLEQPVNYRCRSSDLVSRLPTFVPLACNGVFWAVHFTTKIILIAVFFAVALVFSLWVGLTHPLRIKRAVNDRFELVPGGMKVTRGAKSWIVTNPKAAVGGLGDLHIADAPTVRFGRGLKAAYYFDPRFIEPEETALQGP